MSTHLEQLLAPGALTVHGQPLLRLEEDGTWRPWAVEMLVRGPQAGNFSNAEVLFEYVRRKRAESEMDRCCIEASLAAARALPEKTAVCLNVHASTLGRDGEFVAFLSLCAESCQIACERLIVELVEHVPAWDVGRMRDALRELRDLGARIALDDLGIGHSNLKMILDCHPEFLKLDRSIVHNSSTCPRRQAMIRAVTMLGGDIGARVIGEGVERADDGTVLASAGIRLAQGFLFSRPLPMEALSGDRLGALAVPASEARRFA